jgi:DNA recombination protein RmuC
VWVVLAVALLGDVLLLMLLARVSRSAPATPDARMERLLEGQARLESTLRDEMGRSRTEIGAQMKEQRVEVSSSVGQLVNTVGVRLEAVRQADEQRQEHLRTTVETRLRLLQEDNTKSLEQMRQVVDQRLQATLEQRLGESFKRVSEHLESVHKGLGEMQALASGVGDLRKVLTNVKVRGTWGEAQLGNLLAEILAPEQFAVNIATRAGSSDRVEFAIRLPGRDAGAGPVWLPVDAKFPQEDFLRLVDASERADAEGVELASKALEGRLKGEAKDIRDKYLDPPNTTDFAILYLPIESLYAEVLRRPGLCESLQREYRVVVAGPTTFAALLNSLQVGFRTLAIERRSAEVWVLLGSVKTEFEKFGEALDRVQKKIGEAGTALEKVGTRSRVLGRKLKDVQSVPVDDDALALDDEVLEEEAGPET